MTKSVGYLHPACVGAYLESHEGDRGETMEALRANSRLPEADLAAIIEQVEA